MALPPIGGSAGTNSVISPKFPKCNLGLAAKTYILISCFESRNASSNIFTILLNLTYLCEVCR